MVRQISFVMLFVLLFWAKIFEEDKSLSEGASGSWGCPQPPVGES